MAITKNEKNIFYVQIFGHFILEIFYYITSICIN